MLLHRFTIDQLADAIGSQIVEGDPDSRLSYRFYRKGRRDGRKRRPTSAIMGYVQNAVELAMSKIAEAHLADDLQLCVEERSVAVEIETLAGASTPQDSSANTTPGSSGQGVSVDRLLEVRASRRAAAADAERKAAQQQSAGLRRRLAEVEERRERLDDVTKQRLESCQQTGHMLWARYLSGYDLGRSKRGVPDDEAPGHSISIEFALPETFAAASEGKD